MTTAFQGPHQKVTQITGSPEVNRAFSNPRVTIVIILIRAIGPGCVSLGNPHRQILSGEWAPKRSTLTARRAFSTQN